jgi:threonine dehydrogenase-like Zn-dependent dehydrogenase
LLPASGRLTITGLPDAPALVDLGTLVGKEIVVRGSLIYDDDFAEALDHIAAGRIPCDRIITTIAPLEQAPTWFTNLAASTTDQVKVLLSAQMPTG